MAFQVHGYELTLRMDDAAKFAVAPIAAFIVHMVGGMILG